MVTGLMLFKVGICRRYSNIISAAIPLRIPAIAIGFHSMILMNKPPVLQSIEAIMRYNIAFFTVQNNLPFQNYAMAIVTYLNRKFNHIERKGK